MTVVGICPFLGVQPVNYLIHCVFRDDSIWEDWASVLERCGEGYSVMRYVSLTSCVSFART